MIFPFVTLTLLIILVPAIGRLDGIWIVGAASATIALALTTIAIAMSANRLARFSRLLRPSLIFALAAPALWMLLQVIPMPAHRLVNPIWASASAALNQPLAGTITVDVGATLLSLAQYCVVVAAALVSAAVALDGQRAARLFYILLAIATLVAIRQIALEMAASDGLFLAAEGRAQAMVVAVIGILLAGATAIQAVDQLSRTSRPQRSRSWAMITLSVVILSLLICGVAILIPADPVVVVAAAFGVGTLLAVFAIRRWMLGPWGAAGIAAAAAIGLLGAFASIPVKKNADLVTALSTQPQPATERMLSDIAPAGSGAGTFRALLPIYQDSATATTQEHPTAAAVITIEMGSTFLIGTDHRGATWRLDTV